MVEEHGNDRTGAQQESPAEREAKKNPAEKQDLEKPSEGRDEPPAETVENGKRSPDSPWMGGGQRAKLSAARAGFDLFISPWQHAEGRTQERA